MTRWLCVSVVTDGSKAESACACASPPPRPERANLESAYAETVYGGRVTEGRHGARVSCEGEASERGALAGAAPVAAAGCSRSGPAAAVAVAGPKGQRRVSGPAGAAPAAGVTAEAGAAAADA